MCMFVRLCRRVGLFVYVCVFMCVCSCVRKCAVSLSTSLRAFARKSTPATKGSVTCTPTFVSLQYCDVILRHAKPDLQYELCAGQLQICDSVCQYEFTFSVRDMLTTKTRCQIIERRTGRVQKASVAAPTWIR